MNIIDNLHNQSQTSEIGDLFGTAKILLGEEGANKILETALAKALLLQIEDYFKAFATITEVDHDVVLGDAAALKDDEVTESLAYVVAIAKACEEVVNSMSTEGKQDKLVGVIDKLNERANAGMKKLDISERE